jgi:hypothetical protein
VSWNWQIFKHSTICQLRSTPIYWPVLSFIPCPRSVIYWPVLSFIPCPRSVISMVQTPNLRNLNKIIPSKSL